MLRVESLVRSLAMYLEEVLRCLKAANPTCETVEVQDWAPLWEEQVWLGWGEGHSSPCSWE